MYLPKETWLQVVQEAMAIGSLPTLPCPCCHKTLLEFKRNSITLSKVVKRPPPNFTKLAFVGEKVNLLEALASVAESVNEATARWFRFSTGLLCPACGETTVVVGEAKAYGENREQVYLCIKGSWPDLPVFDLKKIYPAAVVSELAKSFVPFLRDPTLSGSRVRTAIEVLLDDLGMPRERVDMDGEVKRKRDGKPLKLSLGERLKELESKDAYISGLLGGIKQLGNEATHGGELPYVDLLDAFDLIHHVLEELYVERPKRRAKIRTSNQMAKKYT